jgi:hypothetical protein
VVIIVGISSSVPFLLTSAMLFTETRVRLTFHPSSRRESNYCGEAASDPFGGGGSGERLSLREKSPAGAPLLLYIFPHEDKNSVGRE